MTGVTCEMVQDRRKKYIPSPVSRPNLELPSPSRRRKAQHLAEKWHGQAIVHVTADRHQYGRVVFDSIFSPKWFKIHWEDGSVTEADLRFLRRVGPVDEVQAPSTLIPKLSPVAILTMSFADRVDLFSQLASVEDLQDRLEYFMPGLYTDPQVKALHSVLPWADTTASAGPATLWDFSVLIHALNMDKLLAVVDPWAVAGTLNDLMLNVEYTGKIVANVYGELPASFHNIHSVDTRFNPLLVHLYELLEEFTTPIGVITSPPVALLDLVIPLLAELINGVSCVFVPKSYVLTSAMGRFQYMYGLKQAGRLLEIECMPSGGQESHCVLHLAVHF